MPGRKAPGPLSVTEIIPGARSDGSIAPHRSMRWMAVASSRSLLLTGDDQSTSIGRWSGNRWLLPASGAVRLATPNGQKQLSCQSTSTPTLFFGVTCVVTRAWKSLHLRLSTAGLLRSGAYVHRFGL